MSTFFEKLTGQHQKQTQPTEVETASSQEESKAPRRRTAAIREETKEPRHIKVGVENSTSSPPKEEPEEEGELTVDIYDNGDALVIQSTVAGVKPEDLDVSIADDTVTIRGRREGTEKVAEENYYYKELFWGTFSRTVILPEEIDDDSAEATLKNGLLTLILPKKKRGVVQKLKVKVA